MIYGAMHLVPGKQFVLLAVALFALFCIVGCTAPSDPVKEGDAGVATATGAEPVMAAAASDPRLQAIYEEWQSSSHADTYAPEKGPNTYCARCHSPENWDVAAVIDPPPNCVSCKFPFEDEMRIAEGNPPVSRDEWQDIGCEICHAAEAGGVGSKVSWKNVTTGYREEVANNSELCQRCHQNTETLRHLRVLGNVTHVDFECTDCHNAHSTRASCRECHQDAPLPVPTRLPEHLEQDDASECEECHLSVAEKHMTVLDRPPVACMDCHGHLFADSVRPRLQEGHSVNHIDVACVACHDASGLEVGPVEGQNSWMTFRSTELLGRISREVYQSHNLTQDVDCTRCHFPDNPWDLMVDVSEGK
jgi:hypothetical protein